MPEGSKSSEVDQGRRNVLKVMVFASAFLSLAGTVDLLRVLGPAKFEIPPWPRTCVANIKNLKVKEPLFFNYPLETTPNILIKLGYKIENGVGPDGDIIAYSALCQHLGCIVRFLPSGSSESSFKDKDVIYCPCHAAYYDVAGAAKVLAGPPLYPLPMVKLEYDPATGDIYAVGMYPPVIFGKGSPGSTDVSRDLIGGKLVPSSACKS
jgi:arsenite oxidase small subunit